LEVGEKRETHTILKICYGGYQDGTLVDVFGTTKELRYITIDEHKKGIADVIKGEGFLKDSGVNTEVIIRNLLSMSTKYGNNIKNFLKA
jgi:hypothetical protein